MERFALGQSVAREEDPRLLKGLGRFLDDVALPRMCHAAMVRSPHAHAEIRAVDTAAAAAAPGVLAVLTGADYAADGLGSIPCEVPRRSRNGGPMHHPPHPPLVRGRARAVGDAAALVVAETAAQARDAAELVEIDYRPLPAVADTAEAAGANATRVWDDCPGNESWHAEVGDAPAVEAAFARADRVVRRRFTISRVAANALEPRGCIGDYDRREGRYTLYTGLQNPHQLRQQLAETFFGLPETRFRVVAGDVGGSFGMRGATYPELVLVVWASRRVGRPVKWVCERGEGFVSDDHARDNVTDAALALAADGGMLALKVETVANMGAYIGIRGTMPPVNNLGTLAGTYTTGAIHAAVSGVFSNTCPTGPYRGAGRPEAAYVIERMVDLAAAELGVDRVALRRRNTIPPDAMPYRTGLTFTYDSGAFEANIDRALALIDHAGLGARKRESAASGRLRGFGISNTIEQAGAPNVETAEIRFDATGTATLLMGTISHGQGHETMYKQILGDRLGLAPEAVRVVEGDTDRVTWGRGTFGSRSAVSGGTAVVLAAAKVADKGRALAAHLLEAAEADVEFADGAFTVAGTDRSVDVREVARASYVPSRLPDGMEPGLDETAHYVPEAPTFPNGCHVCEVEIDPETGAVAMDRYAVVDDVGTVVNPLLLKGQIHGGVAQGLGQALMERIVYDPASGQNLTGSFMDYAMPRADDLCAIEVESNPAPTAANPLGVKGAGEAGTVGALPAVAGAVADALAARGIDHVEMPASPERVWRALASG